MGTLQQLEALNQAFAILDKACKALACGPHAIYAKVSNARTYLNNEVDKLLAE